MGGETRKLSSRFEKAVCLFTVHVKGSVCPDEYNRQFLCSQEAVAPPTPAHPHPMGRSAWARHTALLWPGQD